ncbi:hypothetical protein E2C01_091641 [Portunus trituberculatus]|uniref:Uncharacterized protein n=1 Tax=Portunus trituberculatus TaxID=210409 RepID=A0A5B7JJJ6_PORTR|nr:hypothetical protein [Portunus trituberculatus]
MPGQNSSLLLMELYISKRSVHQPHHHSPSLSPCPSRVLPCRDEVAERDLISPTRHSRCPCVRWRGSGAGDESSESSQSTTG